jgi:hypothetical protein
MITNYLIAKNLTMKEELKEGKDQSKIIYLNTEGIQEYLYNIVQDAQTLGSVVQLVTITPTFVREANGQIQAVACLPKDVICPK